MTVHLLFILYSLFPSSNVIKLFEYYIDNDYHTIANSLDDIKFYKKCIIEIKCVNGLFDSIYVNMY